MNVGHRCLLMLASLLPAVLSLRGQEADDHSPWSISLAGGATLPALSGVQAQLYPQSLSGDPRQGPIVAASAEYELLPWLVGTVQANYARRAATDLSAAELFPPCYTCGLGGGSSRTTYDQQQGEWAMAQILGGLGLRGTDGRFSATLHVEGGAQWTQMPAVEVHERGTLWILGHPQYGTYAKTTVQAAAGAWSLVGGGGVDFGFRLGPRLGLRLGTALHAAAVSLPCLSETTTISQVNGSPGTGTQSFSPGPIEVRRAIAAYQVTLGVTYRFPSWY